MENPTQTLKALEHQFWQSMVDNDTDAALDMLGEPALLVSPMGAMKFDHAGYRHMAEQGTMVLDSFEISAMQILLPTESTAILSYDVKQVMTPRDRSGRTEQRMHDTSTWVRKGAQWKCVMHTETPVDGAAAVFTDRSGGSVHTPFE